MSRMMSRCRAGRVRSGRLGSAFTLVEILIVVVILGILAAVVVPQFSKAVQDSSETATFDQLNKVRRAVTYYYATTTSWPNVTAGDGTWGPLLGNYMRDTPANFWVPGPNSKVITIGSTADSAYQTGYGWIYDDTTGDVWAGGFDLYDNPLPRP